MHDDSCIGINYAHRFPKCFRSLHTLLGFSLCTSNRPFNCCSCTHLFNFWPVREFLVEIHTAKTGLLRCCLYTQNQIMVRTSGTLRSSCTSPEKLQCSMTPQRSTHIAGLTPSVAGEARQLLNLLRCVRKSTVFAPPILSDHETKRQVARVHHLRTNRSFISSHKQSCDQTHRCLHHQACQNKHVCSFHQSLKRTNNQTRLPSTAGWPQAIVPDLELTDDAEWATETHAGASELDRVVEGDDPGEVRQTHHVACTVVEKNLITQRRQNANGDKPRHLRGNLCLKKTLQVKVPLVLHWHHCSLRRPVLSIYRISQAQAPTQSLRLLNGQRVWRSGHTPWGMSAWQPDKFQVPSGAV